MRTLLTLDSDKLHYIGRSLNNPHHIALTDGVTVVAGQNGAGKSTLAAVVERGWNLATNRITTPDGQRLKVKRIEFTDIHSLSGNRAEYHQQRYESSANDEVPTVGDIIGRRIESPEWRQIAETLRIDHIASKRVNFLSSGELRKLLIADAITGDAPDLLILDNPYIGLDARSRSTLDAILPQLPQRGIAVMMIICDPDDIPDYADSLITISDMTLTGRHDKDREGAEKLRHIASDLFDFAVDTSRIPTPPPTVTDGCDEIVRLTDCCVSHSGIVLLPSVSWRIMRGERWALSGPNGSGKSTLLSLIHADNPQAYSNDVRVFGRRRGTGESIWDIKRRIGYISPEMHLYFNGGNRSALEIIARGLNDTVGFFTRITPKQTEVASRWVSLLHLDDIAGRAFNTLSAGEQRMVLLARTLVKNPELLILDEPLHGLDRARKRAVRAVVNTLAMRDGTTMVYVTHRTDETPECVDHALTLAAPQR